MPQGTALPGTRRAASAERTPPGQALMRVIDRTPVWVWTGLVVATLLLFTLFWGGAVGVADDGTGARLACEVGVEAPNATGDFVSMHLERQEWSPDACPSGGLPSSHEVLARTSMVIGWLAGFGPGLDLRVLALLSVALAVVATMAWTRTVPGPGPVKALAGLGVGIVLADGAVSPFFVSLYRESVTVLGLVGLMAVWVSPRRSILRFAVVGTLVLLSGPHMGPMALVLAVAVVARGIHGDGRLRRALHRMGAVVVAALFLGVASLTATPSPEHTNFSGQTPRTAWVERDSSDAGALLDRHRDLAQVTTTMRDTGYGNVPVTAGNPPKATICRLCVVSAIVRPVAPIAAVALPAFWLVAIRVGLQLISRARRAREPARRSLGELLVLLPATAMAHHGYVVVTGGTGGPAWAQMVGWVATALVLPMLVPAGWATYTLGVRLGEKPGLLRRLGSRFAAALTVPGPLTLPAHVSEPGRVTLPALITLPGRVIGGAGPVITAVPGTTGSGSWTGLEVWADRLAHADRLRRPELRLRPASVPWAGPRATSSGVAVGSAVFHRSDDGDRWRRCRVARTRWLAPTRCGRRRSYVARGRAPPRAPPTVRGGRAPPPPAPLTRGCRYRAPP